MYRQRTLRLIGSVAAGIVATAALLSSTVPARAEVRTAQATATASPTATASSPTPTATPSGTPSPVLCPDPGPAPTGVTASANLVSTDRVRARLTWTPLPQPAGCSAGTVEIEQVTPPGPTIRTSAATGEILIENLRTLTAYTWRLRYVSGTVSEWATVSVGQVLPLDYCLALPGPRPIVGTALSPTSVHLEWGTVSYPSVCSGNVTVTNVTAGTPAVTVSRTETGITIDGLTPGSTNTWLVSFMVQLGQVTVTQPADTATAACTAVARVDSAWGGGFTATVTVRNTGTQRISPWNVRWTLPTGTQVTVLWNATSRTDDGVLTASGAHWNSALAPDASTTFGFVASRTGSGPVEAPEMTCTGQLA